MIEYSIVDKVRKSIYRIDPTIGAKFGEFTIISDKFYKTKTSNHIHLKCKCSCDNISYQRCDRLKKGEAISCYTCSQVICGNKYPNIGSIPGTLYTNVKTRAKESNRSFDLTQSYLNELFIEQEGKCAISGINLTTAVNITKGTASLDRIDSSKGYIKGNVQWLHKRVNIMKGNMKQSTFISLCKLISTNNLQDNFDLSLLNEYSFNTRQ